MQQQADREDNAGDINMSMGAVREPQPAPPAAGGPPGPHAAAPPQPTPALCVDSQGVGSEAAHMAGRPRLVPAGLSLPLATRMPHPPARPESQTTAMGLGSRRNTEVTASGRVLCTRSRHCSRGKRGLGPGHLVPQVVQNPPASEPGGPPASLRLRALPVVGVGCGCDGRGHGGLGNGLLPTKQDRPPSSQNTLPPQQATCPRRGMGDAPASWEWWGAAETVPPGPDSRKAPRHQVTTSWLLGCQSRQLLRQREASTGTQDPDTW